MGFTHWTQGLCVFLHCITELGDWSRKSPCGMFVEQTSYSLLRTGLHITLCDSRQTLRSPDIRYNKAVSCAKEVEINSEGVSKRAS